MLLFMKLCLYITTFNADCSFLILVCYVKLILIFAFSVIIFLRFEAFIVTECNEVFLGNQPYENGIVINSDDNGRDSL